MDPVTLIGVLSGVATILTFLYFLFIGPKSPAEWWRERQGKREASLAPATPPKPEPPAIPSNLPPRSEFIGREKEKARVQQALASRYPLTCIDGIGGIGKSALALEAASECLQASRGEIPANGIPTFAGFIWTTAKDRELILNDVLDAIARTLDYPGIAQQPLEEKQESVRKLLQSKRYLLIVDSFEAVKDNAVRDFLLQLPEPSKALITSREQKIRQAWAVSLKGLEQAEALALIRSEGRRLGLAAVEKGEEQVLLRLYQATGGAPLAIKWAVGQIKQKGQSLDTVLAALHEARGDIFEEVFARSWSLLSDDARHILMVMPIFAASASRDAIEAASDVHHYALDEGLGQLVEMWLVEASEELDIARRRYSIHPLTRAFAEARLGEDRGWEREARERVASYFLNFAKQHGGEKWEDYDMLELERENIFRVMDWYYSVGQWVEPVECVMSMVELLLIRGYWQEHIKYSQQAIEVSKLNNQSYYVAELSRQIARIYYRLGEYDKCQEYYEQSLAAFRHLGNQKGAASILYMWGAVERQREHFTQARKMCEESLATMRMLNDQYGIATALYNLGFIEIEDREGNLEKVYMSL